MALGGAVCLTAIALAGCGSRSFVMPACDGAFWVAGSSGRLSGAEEKARLVEDADAYCRRSGKSAVVIASSENDAKPGTLAAPGKLARATVQFRCRDVGVWFGGRCVPAIARRRVGLDLRCCASAPPAGNCRSDAEVGLAQWNGRFCKRCIIYPHFAGVSRVEQRVDRPSRLMRHRNRYHRTGTHRLSGYRNRLRSDRQPAQPRQPPAYPKSEMSLSMDQCRKHTSRTGAKLRRCSGHGPSRVSASR